MASSSMETPWEDLPWKFYAKEDDTPFVKVGVTLRTGLDSELVCLTDARRGCFCVECSGRLRAATRSLLEAVVHLRGAFGAVEGNFDVFYHSQERVAEGQVFSSKITEGHSA